MQKCFLILSAVFYWPVAKNECLPWCHHKLYRTTSPTPYMPLRKTGLSKHTYSTAGLKLPTHAQATKNEQKGYFLSRWYWLFWP